MEKFTELSEKALAALREAAPNPEMWASVVAKPIEFLQERGIEFPAYHTLDLYEVAGEEAEGGSAPMVSNHVCRPAPSPFSIPVRSAACRFASSKPGQNVSNGAFTRVRQTGFLSLKALLTGIGSARCSRFASFPSPGASGSGIV